MCICTYFIACARVSAPLLLAYLLCALDVPVPTLNAQGVNIGAF